VVSEDGTLHVHPTREGDAAEWLYVLAHCLLHLGLGHFQQRERPREWNAACDVVVAKFLADVKLGRAPYRFDAPLPSSTEERLYEAFCAHGIPPALSLCGTAGAGQMDMLFASQLMADRRSRSSQWTGRSAETWQELFGDALARAVTEAVEEVAERHGLASSGKAETAAQRARSWFINSYPLLGALAAAFEIVEDPQVCARAGITVAAVDPESREIFVNPAAGLDEPECRFVMAHELLHVGLRHETRRRGRDPYYWNIACDYVINGWLIEMGVGEQPQIGVLHDPKLKGLSAEAVYDLVVSDLRRYRKLATLRGIGLGDMLERGTPDWWNWGEGVTLDEFYRRCLGQGLTLHDDEGRGFLPEGLIEEIGSLAQPPVPWDVELAKWFDEHFPPREKVRTYARPSRRQASTPDIPRPRYVTPPGDAARTYGVVLDTSGSMDRTLLAKALGAISSYSAARDVAAARVVFCDAAAYDQGYMAPEEIAGRVRVRGRGGTVLQPGIDLLEQAKDFPDAGPILVITDGWCDRVRMQREHAYLTPAGAKLPFVPKGPVFRIS
jgi:predicted metal-dependent peptidase